MDCSCASVYLSVLYIVIVLILNIEKFYLLTEFIVPNSSSVYELPLILLFIIIIDLFSISSTILIIVILAFLHGLMCLASTEQYYCFRIMVLYNIYSLYSEILKVKH